MDLEKEVDGDPQVVAIVEKGHTSAPTDGAARTVGQEFFQDDAFSCVQLSRQFDDVDKLGIDGAGGEAGSGEVLEEFLEAKLGEGRRAAEDQHGRGRDAHQPKPCGQGTTSLGGWSEPDSYRWTMLCEWCRRSLNDVQGLRRFDRL